MASRVHHAKEGVKIEETHNDSNPLLRSFFPVTCLTSRHKLLLPICFDGQEIYLEKLKERKNGGEERTEREQKKKKSRQGHIRHVISRFPTL